MFTLQTLPESDPYESSIATVGKVAGFSLHAGVAAKAQQRDKLERLCRYITRPPVSEQRLSLTAHGKVRYELKTPYRDGTTDVIFEPLDFIARLAALDCRDAGGRATQEQLPRCPSQESTLPASMVCSPPTARIACR